MTAASLRDRAFARARHREADGSVPEEINDEAFAPELCRSQTEPPDGDEWLHEIKWDGYRIVATVVGGKVRLWSRNAIEWTAKVPELAKAVACAQAQERAARRRDDRVHRTVATTSTRCRGACRRRTRPLCCTCCSTCRTSTASRCATCR